ncbi:MAG TPA: PD-(D/E)XK nuclease family protein [Phycisphaerae bacterium]|nr:PD-(D/E)XK nuclease family protein [Phycisphaerae bacterium]
MKPPNLRSPDSIVADTFRRLLTDYAALAVPADAKRRDPIVAFMAGFRAANAQVLQGDTLRVAEALRACESFFPGYALAVEAWRKQQEAVADDFNILEVMDLAGDEQRHSMILAWLLDRDITRGGTHAQGSSGFRLFLQEVCLPEHYADAAYRVRREVASDESRIDVEIAARGVFMIHIENKIWAGEGRDQTDREWTDLQKRAAVLDLPTDPPGAFVHALYLTPRGAKSHSPHFRPISWQAVANVLDRFAATARPAEVRVFASHCARVLRKTIIRELAGKENNGAEEQVQ